MNLEYGGVWMETGNASSFIKMLAKNRNTVFLYLCLIVHLSYFLVFLVLKLTPLSVLNLISSVIYIMLLGYEKKHKGTEKVIVEAYLEIMGFAIISEIFFRGTYGFICFIIGMIPVIHYLAPSYKNKRFIYQFLGVGAGLLVYNIKYVVPDNFFADVFELSQSYAGIFKLVNLIITFGTVIYTSFVYEVELDRIRCELDYNCTHDALTGLYNRRFLYDMIKNTEETGISTAILDVDNFKKINDKFGHDVGDDVLVKISSCLIKEANDNDVFSVRWGGEEFVLYYENINIEKAHQYISKLCSEISEQIVLPDDTHVTVTAGLAGGIKSDFEKIIKQADEYLYRGKQNGKNCVVWEQSLS